MYSPQKPTRTAPGIFTYMEMFSSRFLAYALFFGMPVFIALMSMIFNAVFMQSDWDFYYCIEIYIIFMAVSGSGEIFCLFFSKRAPILGLPPRGWSIHFNSFFSSLMGASFLIGQLVVIYTQNIAFQEIFFILGSLVAYILAFTIYFSFTTVTKFSNYIILALVQPVVGIILYSIYTAQFHLDFFLKAMLFFTTCALLFLIPYARGFFHVSNIYKKTTGLGGYGFIRAFVLSMMTEGNDDRIETLFDNVGITTDVRVQYLLIRNENTKNLKGVFVVPNVHFGPFKTCGSSDLPEQIYKSFGLIPGATVYHTTNTHTQNLTRQNEVNKILKVIQDDINAINNNSNIVWETECGDFDRKISNSAKLIGMVIGDIAMVYVTRHPLPSDDIQEAIGQEIREDAKKEGFKEIIIVDSHNAIIGDEVPIIKDTIEAKDITTVAHKFMINHRPKEIQKDKMLYGVAKDPINEYSEKDGIGYGGMVVHLFKNVRTKQKTALVHIDANNAYVDIRSFVLNKLQNKGIERGEITTSDSHTVARQFTSRGYSPLGDKIKLEFILEKIDHLLKKAEKNLEPVEFYYKDTLVENVRIWGNESYFEVIMETLQECISVSQKLLTFSLLFPTIFSLILLLFYYNIPIWRP